MSVWSGRIRRRILTPDVRQVSLEVRGFPTRDPRAKAQLEAAGTAFVEGFAVAAERDTAGEAAAVLRDIGESRRGFTFEGAAMALAIRDALPLGHSHHVADFLAVADEHVYMIYVGAGWALARLPRPLRRAALTGLTDPVLSWLALDGYGFHQAYFHTDRYVRRRYVDAEPPVPLPRHADYAQHAIDQGIGRAMWFVAGADPGVASAMIDEFPAHRRGDLLAGLGLAIGYAGGAVPADLGVFEHRSVADRRCLGQGVAFAAEARARARIPQPHTEFAARLLTGHDADAAAAIARDTRPTEPTIDGRVAYEVWRERIRQRCLPSESSSTLDPTTKAQVHE
ncbi:DUF1702 family protein [Nocardia sp. NPDC060256]|uniref:DUF1702 family protein n=1 Tax=unclassified Nocardia TaxID=2637762 RepID=UPI00366807C9